MAVWWFSLFPLLLAVRGGLGDNSLPQQVHIAATGESFVHCRSAPVSPVGPR